MKASSFEYVSAGTLAEAFAVLGERGDDARILAGGQSLIPAINMRLATPDILVDVSRIADLQGIRVLDNVLRIGAMVRYAEMYRSPAIAKHAPLIFSAIPNIAHAAIRNRGTFGGSLCNADPASELPACALALDAACNIQSAAGSRTVPAREFFRGIYTTCLGEDEILVSVDVPLATAHTVTFFAEISRRQGDYAMAGLAVKAILQDQHLADARIVFFAVSEMAVSAPSAESLLSGAHLSDIDSEAVCRAIGDDITPVDDLTTSGEAKLAIMKTLTRRALASLAEQGKRL